MSAAGGSRNIEKFTVDLSRMRGALRERLDEAFQHVCLRGAEEIIVGRRFSPGTPVDTGFARNSWSVGINSPGADRQPAARAAGEEGSVDVTSLDEAQLAILGAKASSGDIVYLTSNCVYMRRLEYGHSQQAPNGMVRLTLQHAQEIADEVAAEMTAGSGGAR